MQYSNFECDGKNVSKLGFGLMRLPKIEKDSEKIDRAEAARIVDLAYKNGVNYFDTAYFYHDGESEFFVKEALARYPRDTFFLATKMPGGCLKDGKTPDFLFNDQLGKCGVGYFDFYLLHAVSDDNFKYFEESGAYEYLTERKKEGKIKKLGFSYHGSFEFFKKVLDTHEWDFVQLQLNYYDWDASNAKDFYAELEKRGIPCIVMEPVRGGSLNTLNDEARAVFSKLGEASPASYALRYVAQLKNVIVVLSGMSTFEQVEDNIKTFNECKPLAEKETAAVENAAVLFRKNFAIPCTACKYCVAACPGGVAIPDCFTAFNKYNETRNTADFKAAYAEINEAARAASCLDCKACIERCPQGIDIPDKLRKVAALANK